VIYIPQPHEFRRWQQQQNFAIFVASIRYLLP